MNRKRIALGVILLAVAGGGCTSQKLLPMQAPPAAYREANHQLAGRRAEVRTTDGGLFDLCSVQIMADSVRGLSPFAGAAVRQFAIGEVFQSKSGRTVSMVAL